MPSRPVLAPVSELQIILYLYRYLILLQDVGSFHLRTRISCKGWLPCHVDTPSMPAPRHWKKILEVFSSHALPKTGYIKRVRLTLTMCLHRTSKHIVEGASHSAQPLYSGAPLWRSFCHGLCQSLSKHGSPNNMSGQCNHHPLPELTCQTSKAT